MRTDNQLPSITEPMPKCIHEGWCLQCELDKLPPASEMVDIDLPDHD